MAKKKKVEKKVTPLTNALKEARKRKQAKFVK